MRLPNSAAPLLVLFIGLPAAFSLFTDNTNQPESLPNEQLSVGLLARTILSTILAVSASEIDLSKLDVKTLVTKMTPPRGLRRLSGEWYGRVTPVEKQPSPGPLLNPVKSTSFTTDPSPAERTANSP